MQETTELRLAKAIIRALERAGAEVSIDSDADQVTATVEYNGQRYVVRGTDLQHVVATAALQTGIRIILE